MADGLLNKASIILTPTGYKAGTLYNVAPVVEPYEDFDFSRASVASRVNSSGLVEMVGRTLGSEFVTNEDFSNGLNNWTTNTATESGGVVTIPNNGYIFQTINFPDSGTIKIQVEGSGTVKYRLGVTSPSGSFITKTLPFTAYEDLNSTDVRIQLNNTSGSDITVTSVSVKEIIDTNNIPRISYDSNGDNGHILLEPTSTNLLPYSEDFTQGWAVSDATITPNSITSPSGQDNASTLTTSASGGTVQETLTISDGDLTFSLFVRKGTTNGVRLRIDAATDVNGYFNINDGTIFSQTDDAKIEVINADWYRVSISASVTSFVKASIYTTDGTTSYDNGTVYIWGGQLEALSYATSYIPTLTGSQEIRATETATGAGSADLINSTEGVLYAEIAALADDNTYRILSLSDGTKNERVYMQYTNASNTVSVVVKYGGVTQANMVYVLSDATNFSKVAIKYKANDFALWVDGVERDTDTSGNTPTTLNKLQFNEGDSSGNEFYGKCKALAVFNEALSPSELTQLTT